jgi:hypothetical protein
MTDNRHTATVSEQESKILDAARAHADALAVLRGTPPFSAWDAVKIQVTRDRLLFEVMLLSNERQPGRSIPANDPAPPDLLALIKRFWPSADGPDIMLPAPEKKRRAVKPKGADL